MGRTVCLLGFTLIIVVAIAGRSGGAAATAAAWQGDDAEAEAEAEAFVAYVVDVATRVDGQWSDVYAGNHREYESPELVLYTETTATACDTLDPGDWASYYCVADATVYLDLIALVETADAYGIGAIEFSVANAWAWHIQAWDRYVWDEAEFTWRADCMGGRWVRHEVNAGILEEAAIEEARAYVWDASGDNLRLDYFDQGLDLEYGCWNVGPG